MNKLFILFLLLIVSTTTYSTEITKTHAISMNGKPKYKEGFTHFTYVNPNAPKKGNIKLSAVGTYDSFNPFILKGIAADGIGLTYGTLMTQSDDEPFTQYGLIAEYIEIPKDRSWVIFHINPKAKFHDNTPITPEDVIFSFNILTTKGNPVYKRYYADVINVTALDSKRVKFSFNKNGNRELPLILGQLNILPKKYWDNHNFSKSTLEIPLGSGPYKIKSFIPGKTITYERVKNYWAKDLPAVKGQYNFDTIKYDYYRDQTISLEAFKSGEYDFIQETRSKQWSTAYTGPNFDNHKIIKETIKHELPLGMQGFAMNSRRELFKDPKVRQALTYAFDFAWTNKKLFYGQYTRTHSYFSNSELASKGLPSTAELEILEPLKDLIPPEVFTTEYRSPNTDGSGNNRANLKKAIKLLKDAGWIIKNKKLVHKETGIHFKFEVLLVSQAFERVMLPYKKNLSRLGIDMKIRLVDTSQYINRIRSFDYDMIAISIGQSNSPGNEQRYFWSSEAADTKGTRNFMGIKNAAIDTLLELVISAPDREQLIIRTRALDRVLLWNHYIIPNWHYAYFRVAYWDKFAKPTVQPKYGLGFYNWWIK